MKCQVPVLLLLALVLAPYRSFRCWEELSARASLVALVLVLLALVLVLLALALGPYRSFRWFRCREELSALVASCRLGLGCTAHIAHTPAKHTVSDCTLHHICTSIYCRSRKWGKVHILHSTWNCLLDTGYFQQPTASREPTGGAHGCVVALTQLGWHCLVVPSSGWHYLVVASSVASSGRLVAPCRSFRC